MDGEQVLVAGGGSGGHVFPALAVAQELGDRGWQVSWLGRERGMERDLVERQGLTYHGLGARAVVGQSAGARVIALGQLAVSAVRARSLIRRTGARVVLGTGGYVSAPGVLGAALARRPVVLIEPNRQAGAANRWLSRFATVAAVAGEAAGTDLRCSTEVTGVPIRSEFTRQAATPPDTAGPLRLLVLGGSQGARQLNRLLPAALAQLGSLAATLEVTHQVGTELLEETRRLYDDLELPGVTLSLVPFIDDVHGEMVASHLIVSRAGAITLAEICAVGRAALLLPLALAGSHQVANARDLETTGGAVALAPETATVERVAQELVRLLSDRERLVSMGRSLQALARPRATASIADLVEKVARAS